MANVVGSKTTKAKEAASLKAARTKHRVGAGQLFIQPTAHADREAALLAAAEKVDPDFPSKTQVDDYQAEAAAIDFITVPAPVEAQAAVTHVRPTAPYVPANRFAPAAPATPEGQFIFIKAYRVRIGSGLISEKQAKWIVDIAERPSVTDAMRESLQVRLEQGFARGAGTAFITKYKDIPAEITPAQAKAGHETSRSGAPLVAPAGAETSAPVEVPAGRYAVTDPTDGVFKFFHLDRPTEGRWKGYTFLKVRASDDLYPIRAKAHRDAVIAAIAEDVEEAQTQYGVQLGRCYRCGRTLTDETSRSLGIGPDCRSK